MERIGGDRFPFRLRVLDNNSHVVLALRTQDRWPAANRNIFCLRDREPPEASGQVEEIERVPVIAMQTRGIRTSIVLDRTRYKRCDFLVLRRDSKSRPGETYEQIYWQTQTSMTQHRPKLVPPALRTRTALQIAIDSRERYPWHFPGSETVRRTLAAGDYALLYDDEPAAVVERKTFENMLSDFGVLPLLHQRLLELSNHEHNALVIEAPYEDFLNPARVHHYSPSFCGAVIADLFVNYPRLRIVFCANRKAANLWTGSYFNAVWQKLQSEQNRTGK